MNMISENPLFCRVVCAESGLRSITCGFYARLIDALVTAPKTWNDASLNCIGCDFKRAD